MDGVVGVAAEWKIDTRRREKPDGTCRMDGVIEDGLSM